MHANAFPDSQAFCAQTVEKYTSLIFFLYKLSITLACPTGTYGQDCQQSCKCKNGDCDTVTGTCTCLAGATGELCDQGTRSCCSPSINNILFICVFLLVCPKGYFGENCQFQCACDHASQVCDGFTGECSCDPGWQPPMCVSGTTKK